MRSISFPYYKYIDVFWDFPDIYFLRSIIKPIPPFNTPKGRMSYNKLNSWHIHPQKEGRTDFFNSWSHKNIQSNIYLFFVHRTTYFSNLAWNHQVKEKKEYFLFLKHSIIPITSIFSKYCNIYAPKYRQATLYSYFDKNDNGQKAIKAAYLDIKDAFEHFIDQIPKDSYIVLAGHSQGSDHLTEILKDYFDNNETLRKRLVIAYLVGYPVKKNSFEKIPISVKSDDTQCYVTWCTFGKGGKPSYFRELFPDTICTNPISWSNDSNETSLNDHLGSLSYDLTKYDEKMITCSIKNNILQISKPKKFRYPCIPKRDFVKVDYHLFYKDIQSNFEERLKKLLLY